MKNKIKVVINGFGRIGRTTFRVLLNHPELELVAINDPGDNKTLAHLLQYDTVFGEFSSKVNVSKNGIKVLNKEYPIFHERDPLKLPWKRLNVDVVLECTGVFTDYNGGILHIKAGARKVIISAPSKDKKVPIYLLGINENKYKGEEVISMGSCTTNCISPVMKVMNKKFGVLKSIMSTVHSYTNDQNIVDNKHRDLRRARAAAQNIIPTTTGAALATAQAMPELNNLFDGMAIRVPTINGSLSDITLVTKKNVTESKVNEAFKEATKFRELKGILSVSNKPLVSSDYIGNPYSCIIDLALTKVVDKNLVKIIAWYDNEWGYSNRLVEMVQVVHK